MEIIKRGVLPETKEYTGHCYHCGTVVKFQKVEARYESNGRNESFLVVTCPVCSREIYTDA